MRVSRFWLALGYVLATVLAQGFHDHRHGEDSASSRHEAGCADPRPHIAGHWSPDLSQPQDDCLVCQFRASHQSWLFTPHALFVPSAAAPIERTPPSAPTGQSRWYPCRAPPVETA